jgi:MFS family permease
MADISTTKPERVKRFLISAVAIVGSGGLIFGYDIGVISGTLGTLKNEFDLDGYEEGLVVSILYAGSIIGAIFGGPLCDIFGRWKTIQVQNIIFIIGALITGLASNLEILCFGRFLVGVASAISGLADVPYLTEIAPTEYRGILSGQYEILVALGILASFCLDLGFSTFHNGWRLAFLLPAVFAGLQSIFLFSLPESPKWSISKKKFHQAKQSLSAIYGETYVDQVLSVLLAHQYDIQSLPTISSYPQDIIDYFQASENGQLNISNIDSNQQSNQASSKSCYQIIQRCLWGTEEEQDNLHAFYYSIKLVLILQILSQITGANVIRNYAPTIFESSGASEQLSLVFNIVLGIVKLLFTLGSVFYIENQGRKRFLMLGCFTVTFGMGFLTILSLASNDYNLQNPIYFIIGCIFIYAGFGFGYGPMPWILSSEFVPTNIRGRIMSWSLIVNNLAQLVVNFLFIPMTNAISTSGSFGIFVLLNILTCLFAWKYLVESRDLSPLEIKKSLFNRYESAFWQIVQHPTHETVRGNDEDSSHRPKNRSFESIQKAAVVEVNRNDTIHNPLMD